MEMRYILDWLSVKDNLYLGIRPITEDRAITFPYLDLEIYMYVMVDEEDDQFATVPVNQVMINIWRIPNYIAFQKAKKNTKGKMKSFWLSSVLDTAHNEFDQFCITNANCLNGAIALYLKDVISEAAKEFDSKTLYIIPSSRHEVLLTNRFRTISEVNEMIYEGNAQIERKDVLSDHVYIYNAASGEIVF